MKKQSVALMLAIMGLMGCGRNANAPESESHDNTRPKVDTALVLRAWPATFKISPKFLVVTQDGAVTTISQRNYGKYSFSDAGDTVIIKNSQIIENMTMENKIKAFSHQK